MSVVERLLSRKLSNMEIDKQVDILTYTRGGRHCGDTTGVLGSWKARGSLGYVFNI